MIQKKSIFLLMLFISFSSISCQSNNLPEDQNMTVADLKEAMKTDSNLVILDVRTPAELEGNLGKIEGAINIPVQVLNDRINELEDQKENNIAVICRSGNRSVTATKILNHNGFKAKNVIGGMIDFNK